MPTAFRVVIFILWLFEACGGTLWWDCEVGFDEWLLLGLGADLKSNVTVNRCCPSSPSGGRFNCFAGFIGEVLEKSNCVDAVFGGARHVLVLAAVSFVICKTPERALLPAIIVRDRSLPTWRATRA